jgi:hypothetical protein
VAFDVFQDDDGVVDDRSPVARTIASNVRM